MQITHTKAALLCSTFYWHTITLRSLRSSALGVQGAQDFA